jgi:hypothetical protein
VTLLSVMLIFPCSTSIDIVDCLSRLNTTQAGVSSHVKQTVGS